MGIQKENFMFGPPHEVEIVPTLDQLLPLVGKSFENLKANYNRMQLEYLGALKEAEQLRGECKAHLENEEACLKKIAELNELIDAQKEVEHSHIEQIRDLLKQRTALEFKLGEIKGFLS